jgi:hypothetical protein
MMEKPRCVITKENVKRWIIGPETDNAWNDFLHREDGPAIIYPDNYPFIRKHYWWYQNKLVDVNSQKEFERWLLLKSFL